MTDEPTKQPDSNADPAQPDTVSKAEYEKAVERARNFEGKLTDLEHRFSGIDPEKVKNMQAELEQLKKSKATNDPDYLETYKAEIDERYKGEYGSRIETLENELNTARSDLKQLRVIDAAKSMMADEFLPEAGKYLSAQLQKDLDWQDGSIVVLGEDGKPRLSPKTPSKPMTLEEYIDELKSSNPVLVKSNAKSGDRMHTHTKPTRGSGGDSGRTLSDYAKMSNEERKKAFTPRERQRLARDLFDAKKTGEYTGA